MKLRVQGQNCHQFVMDVIGKRTRKRKDSDCAGSHECINFDCDFKREYRVVNQTQYAKTHKCRVCHQQGRNVPCSACRYVAFLRKSIRIYHYGKHTCPAKSAVQKPESEVKPQLTENPALTPSAIQSSLIVSQMRQGNNSSFCMSFCPF